MLHDMKMSDEWMDNTSHNSKDRFATQKNGASKMTDQTMIKMYVKGKDFSHRDQDKDLWYKDKDKINYYILVFKKT